MITLSISSGSTATTVCILEVMVTVLVIIKLTNFSVPVRFRCGCSKLNLCLLFHHFLRYLRTLYIVWSLVKRRITRRLTMRQTTCNSLAYR